MPANPSGQPVAATIRKIGNVRSPPATGFRISKAVRKRTLANPAARTIVANTSRSKPRWPSKSAPWKLPSSASRSAMHRRPGVRRIARTPGSFWNDVYFDVALWMRKDELVPSGC